MLPTTSHHCQPHTYTADESVPRDNVVLGSALDLCWYREVVMASGLAEDLEAWPAGDMTLVGERGAALSGGQKTRIALARAMYQVCEKPNNLWWLNFSGCWWV